MSKDLNTTKQEKLDKYLREKREEKIAESYRKKGKLSSRYKFTIKTRCNYCKKIFDDKWEGTPHNVICPHCNKVIKLGATEEDLKKIVDFATDQAIRSNFGDININIKPKELKEYLRKEEGRKIV